MRISKLPEERKKEILDVAELLFTTKGYSNTTIKNILQEIGIAKGTFYYYFKSKEEVMDAVINRYIGLEVASAKEIASNKDISAPEKLLQIIMNQEHEGKGKEKLIEELHQIDNAEMHQKSLTQTIIQLTPILTDVIEQGIAEGIFHTEYPQETVEMLLITSGFLFDNGIFEWEQEELLIKAQAFIMNTEKVLGAEQGSFDYLLAKLM